MACISTRKVIHNVRKNQWFDATLRSSVYIGPAILGCSAIVGLRSLRNPVQARSFCGRETGAAFRSHAIIARTASEGVEFGPFQPHQSETSAPPAIWWFRVRIFALTMGSERAVSRRSDRVQDGRDDHATDKRRNRVIDQAMECPR